MVKLWVLAPVAKATKVYTGDLSALISKTEIAAKYSYHLPTLVDKPGPEICPSAKQHLSLDRASHASMRGMVMHSLLHLV